MNRDEGQYNLDNLYKCLFYLQFTIHIHFRSLTRLNLSYNRISNVQGLSDLHGTDSPLSHLELQGNQIRSVEHLITSLRGLHRLTDLTLMHDGSGNPVCDLPGALS